MTVVDPISALVYVFQNYVSYQTDDATPVTQNYANNGLAVEVFPQEKNRQKIAPIIEVGPMHPTEVTPENIGNTPNSRWLHKHFIECSIDTQTFQNPNISGYSAKIQILGIS